MNQLQVEQQNALELLKMMILNNDIKYVWVFLQTLKYPITENNFEVKLNIKWEDVKKIDDMFEPKSKSKEKEIILRRFTFPAQGWIKKEIKRENGKTKGRIDIFYFLDGKKFNSIPEVERHLGYRVPSTDIPVIAPSL